jgi:hypothetical protein
MEPVTRVIYYSRNRLAGSPTEMADAIDKLLDVCRRENSKCGLTGALMFNQSCFAQVLEGPADAVEATYRRIARDPRHSDIELLADGQVPQRSFPTWSMAYVGCSDAKTALYREIAERTGFNPVGMNGDALLQALRTFVEDTDTRP